MKSSAQDDVDASADVDPPPGPILRGPEPEPAGKGQAASSPQSASGANAGLPSDPASEAGAPIETFPTNAATGGPPEPEGQTIDWVPAAGGLLVLTVALAAVFSTLAASLLRALPSDVSAGASELEQRKALDEALERAEPLAAAAGLAAYMLRVAAVCAAFFLLRRGAEMELLPALGVAVFVAGPTLHLITSSIPLAVAQAHHDGLLRAALPASAVILAPLTPVVAVLGALRRALLRAVRIPDTDHGARRLVEGFRAMVEDAEIHGELGEDTRELIANVIDFGGADAAEVMTPRTEVRAIDVDASIPESLAVFADSGYSRIPVYEDTVDTIIGTLTALEAAKAVAEERVDTTRIRSVMRPPLLVPETKLVPELLAEFRAQRQKMAIVVDEYGGTAGLVTLADVMAEIVGHVKDEFETETWQFLRREDGSVEADASLHVSEVNEALALQLPEEAGFETLGGFVLSELGRFPREGESFEAEQVTYTVTEASDRRVLRVALDRPGGLVLDADEDGSPAPGDRPGTSELRHPSNGSPRAGAATGKGPHAAGGPREHLGRGA